MNNGLNKTPLNAWHHENDAKMVDFGGWDMPVQYADGILLLGVDSSYQYGDAKDVFSAEQIERVFGVRGFTGRIGREKLFIPLGKFAKDSNQINRKRYSG